MCSCIRVTYLNTANVSLSIVVWMDITNAGSQTIGISTAQATMASGQSRTFDIEIFGLSHGTYTALIFVTTVSGVVVSGPVTISFSV